ncbi:MAG: GNAT family N-acetyltransferase, partial [Acidimicrobiia bacterium]
ERFRGRGLAAVLIGRVMTGILERGDKPMLHAAASNTGATRLYEALGFRFTNPFVGIALQPPA